MTGKGSGAEWFDHLGYSAEEVGRKLKDPNRFLDEIIGKIQKLDRASQTRVLDELFGGVGAEQLSKVLVYSVDEIRKMRNEEATFTDGQIEAAKKVDREFATLWRNFTVYASKPPSKASATSPRSSTAYRGPRATITSPVFGNVSLPRKPSLNAYRPAVPACREDRRR